MTNIKTIKSKILFISPNRQTKPHRVTPVGILYLAAGLLEKKHAVKVVDLMFSSDPSRDIVNAIQNLNPDIICISIRNVNKTYTEDANVIPDIVLSMETVKKHSTCKTIVGGPGFSLMPEELMKKLKPDFGIIGEADHSLPALVACIQDQKEYRDIPGLIYQDKEGILRANPPDRIPDLDTIPFQVIELINFKKYGKRAGNLGLFTRKSCPQRCIYCAESQINGRQVRLRSAGRVVDEIEYLIDQTGIADFDFSDTVFNVPREHAMNVCREIIRRHIKFQFEVELNPIGQDAESVSLLKDAGCRAVTLTADSGSDRMLKQLQKGFASKEVLEVATLYAQFNIPYIVCFLLGGPGEDLASIRDSITLAENCPQMTAALFAFGIRVFDNTALRNMMINEGLGGQENSFLEPKWYLSSTFDDQCAELLLDACSRRCNFFLSQHAFCFNSKLVQWLSNYSKTRPTWKYLRYLGLLLKIKNFGQRPLYWDGRARTFKCT